MAALSLTSKINHLNQPRKQRSKFTLLLDSKINNIKNITNIDAQIEKQPSKITVLMFPWLAHGHISPHLELAKKLSKRNFNIFLCSTAANLGSIRKKLGEKFALSIQLVELLLPTLPDLPARYHTTNGLPPHLMPTLKKAFAMASPNFTNILINIKPDLLIYDDQQPWAPTAALKLNIPAVQYISTSATMASYVLHLYNNPGVEYPFKQIYLRDNETPPDVRSSEHLGKNPHMKCLELSSSIVLVKSFKEIEGKYSDYLCTLAGKKMVPLGPLVQDPVQEDEDSEIIQWLNKKESKSTVFASFGSEYFLTKEDLQEIALGFELSRVNFVWVVRFPMGHNITLQEALPKGFLERVGDRGMVVDGWAPQAKILCHSSIGGFVSHCGWSSVMESMKFGVPIIAMPMHLDQPVNARLVEDVGVGVEVVRKGDGTLDRNTVAAVVRKVVAEQCGDIVRKKAKDLSETIRLKGDEEIDVVVKEIVQLCLRYKKYRK